MNRIYLSNSIGKNKKGLWLIRLFKVPFLFSIACLFIPINYTWADTKEPTQQFLFKHFKNQIPKPKRLWLNKERQTEITSQINPSQLKLSYRYWTDDNKTIWILDEIGKERDITTGILIENNRVQNVEVLVYRESRGGQVQNPKFTQQYYQKNDQSNLTKEIDSISGATLSVNALNKQVNLALLLNHYIIKETPQKVVQTK